MSEATMTAPASGGRPKVSKISEAVIRIAGNSQDGIQAIGGFLARLAGIQRGSRQAWPSRRVGAIAAGSS